MPAPARNGGAPAQAPLRPYHVDLRLPTGQRLVYTALATSSAKAIMDAHQLHGLCRVSARPEKKL